MSTNQTVTIRDLLILTFTCCTLLGVGLQVYGILLDPIEFASSLSHQNAGSMMIACTFGLVLFPVLIHLFGFFALRKSKSPFRSFYVFTILASAIVSVHFAYVVAKACAMSIV